MSNTTSSLQRKLGSAKELQSVVRTVNALTASSIGQYENSIKVLADYSRSLELGLGAYFRQSTKGALLPRRDTSNAEGEVAAIVFGSDQGLVGQFNDVVADYAAKKIKTMKGTAKVWAVGERVHSRLVDSGLSMKGLFSVPNSVKAITPLVGQILEEYEKNSESAQLFLFYNHSTSGVLYAPVDQRLLPLDETWLQKLVKAPWPTEQVPEIMGTSALRALIREYLFISIFKSSAESLASENAYRLAAMQRADKNIADLLANLTSKFNHLRQSRIDEELFDVVSGFETLSWNSEL
jgi:F-type H+-transporting ATPase subunit gamma